MAARNFRIALRRTVTETSEIVVEAPTRQAAAFLAGKATPEWMAESESVKVVSVDLDE